MQRFASPATRLALFILAVCVLLANGFSGTLIGQDNSANAIRGAFPCALQKGLDSKKAKEGDPVVCQTTKALRTQDGNLIPSGTKIIGHITEAKARSKGDSESSLAMTFDKIELSKGNDVPIKGTVQAVAPSTNAGIDSGPTVEPGLHGGAAVSNAQTTLDMGKGGPHGAGPLSTDSKGSSLKNVDLGDNSVLTCSGKELKLDNGTQLVVHAE
jgi:hypothetical protein